MSWRQFVQEYLKFGKRDRTGVLVVLGIIGLTYLIPRLFAKEDKISISVNQNLLTTIDTLHKKQTPQYEGNDEDQIAYNLQPSIPNSFSKRELFIFDPNLLPYEGWKKLGLNDKSIKTIINYRAKGGKFYKPEDLKKIWGLPEGFYDYVSSHISIEKQNQKTETFSSLPKEAGKTRNVDINTADTLALIALPGIGSKLALRIVNFREKLGGFYSVEQIGETYGLADSAFQKIKPFLHVSGDVEKFNINTSTKDNLKIHPYIKWPLANAIVEYRNQHGNFKQLEDLKNITMLDESTFNKIVHYLSL